MGKKVLFWLTQVLLQFLNVICIYGPCIGILNNLL